MTHLFANLVFLLSYGAFDIWETRFAKQVGKNIFLVFSYIYIVLAFLLLAFWSNERDCFSKGRREILLLIVVFILLIIFIMIITVMHCC